MIPVKMHQMPGDVSKGTKIAMMEGRSTKRSKSFRKTVRLKERAVLRERSRREIAEVV